MNIEVKRSIELDSVLQVLKERSETNKVGKMGKEVVIEKDVLKDAVSVIEVLVKKNKQLRDINKNLNEKLERRNATISDLASKVKENNCCCEKETEKNGKHTFNDVLNEL